MGIWDAFSDIVEAVTPWSVVEAEAPAEDKHLRVSLVRSACFSDADAHQEPRLGAAAVSVSYAATP
ncbi:ubiquionol cytochrome C reductase hinge protein [Ilyonectria robusta]